MGSTDFSLFIFVKTFIEGGGVFMYPILLTWLIGLSISFYKFISLKVYDVNEKKLFSALKGLIIQNKIEEAINLCSNTRGLLPRILLPGLQRSSRSKELIVDAISTSINELTPKIGYKLSYISLAGNISTLLGLLGTIQGLILAFASISNANASEKSKLLSLGIANAMNTTALGLISAISLMIVHSILVSKGVHINDKIDEVSSKVIDLINSKK